LHNEGGFKHIIRSNRLFKNILFQRAGTAELITLPTISYPAPTKLSVKHPDFILGFKIPDTYIMIIFDPEKSIYEKNNAPGFR
jgi:hypothetical protein